MKYIIEVEDSIDSCDNCVIHTVDRNGWSECAITQNCIDSNVLKHTKHEDCPLIEVKALQPLHILSKDSKSLLGSKGCWNCEHLHKGDNEEPCISCNKVYNTNWKSCSNRGFRI